MCLPISWRLENGIAADHGVAHVVALWLSEITVCLGRGGWQQNHITMMPLTKLGMSSEGILRFLLPPAPNKGRRQPQTRGCALFLSFLKAPEWGVAGYPTGTPYAFPAFRLTSL